VLFDNWISKTALAAFITSCGVAYASDLPITADGWKLVGISPTAEAFWIRTSSISGPKVDRQVLLAIATPSRGVEISTAHIDCNELKFYRVLQDGRRSSPVKIATRSTWQSISKAICKEKGSDAGLRKGVNSEKSVLETGRRGIEQYSLEIAANPWMSDAAVLVCNKLAGGASLEEAGGAMAFTYGKQLVKLWGVKPGDSLRTIDEESAKDRSKPILYIAMTQCPKLVSNAPLLNR
jgi:hypothetical protein